MAALIRHGSFVNAFRSTSAILNTTPVRHDITRNKSKTKNRPKNVVKTTINSQEMSLAARGFLRQQKNYDAPKDTSERINRICESQSISASSNTIVEDLLLRFKLFVACEKEFKHSIPNSLLCVIQTIGDLKEYYATSVSTVTPYEAFQKMDLPKNLHIQQNYHRFHPDTDTMFDGVTAFPKSSTLVTGLKYKKKYPGHKQQDPWIDEMMKI